MSKPTEIEEEVMEEKVKNNGNEESVALKKMRGRVGNEFQGIKTNKVSQGEILDLLRHEITDPDKRSLRSKKKIYLGDRIYDLLKNLKPTQSVKIGPLENDDEVKVVMRSVGQIVRNRLKWKFEQPSQSKWNKKPAYVYEVQEISEDDTQDETEVGLWIVLLRLPETQKALKEYLESLNLK